MAGVYGELVMKAFFFLKAIGKTGLLRRVVDQKGWNVMKDSIYRLAINRGACRELTCVSSRHAGCLSSDVNSHREP